ncbi:MAG: hypothetical protein KF777_14355 [Planctomycetaceae bacterium]|nr:hypothetical protein [Planctomycetaceae bacterium]
MSRCLQRLIDDDSGLILSAEMVIIVTVTVIGVVVGLASARDALVGELTDIGFAFRSLNQSFGYTGMHGCRKFNRFTSWTSGSSFFDYFDGCYGVGTTYGVAEMGSAAVYGGGGAAVVNQPAPALPSVSPCPQGTPCHDAPALNAPTLDATPCPSCLPMPGQPVPEPEVPAGPVPQVIPQG